MKIGENLKKARTNKSLTQEQVPEKIAVSRQTISNWETEKSYPDIISVIKLSDIYQISLEQASIKKGTQKQQKSSVYAV